MRWSAASVASQLYINKSYAVTVFGTLPALRVLITVSTAHGGTGQGPLELGPSRDTEEVFCLFISTIAAPIRKSQGRPTLPQNACLLPVPWNTTHKSSNRPMSKAWSCHHPAMLLSPPSSSRTTRLLRHRRAQDLRPEEPSLGPLDHLLVDAAGRVVHDDRSLARVDLGVQPCVADQVDDPLLARLVV